MFTLKKKGETLTHCKFLLLLGIGRKDRIIIKKINWIFVKFVFHIFSLWSLFLFQLLFVYMCLILYVVNHLSFSFILFLWKKLKSCLSITQLFWVLTNGLLHHIRVTFCHIFIEKDIFGTMFWGSWSKKDIIKV